MINLSGYTILVMDYHNYIEAAQALSKYFGTVYYYAPYNINGFPEHNPYDVGRNVEGITRVDEWTSVIGEVDMAFFCDCYDAETQIYFESIGIPVFGAKRGIELENNRKLLKEVLKEVGLPVSKYELADGLDALTEILKKKNNVYVKSNSNLRGDGETWKHIDYRLSKYRLEEMAAEMSVFKTQPQYVVDEAIESIGEIGIDTPVVNGLYPEMVGTGLEVKDTCYVGRIMPYRNLPEPLKKITDKLSPVFASYNYKGWFSNEVIIAQDLKGYLCDATCRLPAPPISLFLEMINNFGEVAWNVAHGIIPTIEYDSTWGVELIIKSDRAETKPSPVLVPDEFKKKVKLKNLVIEENGTWVYVPHKVKEAREIGSIVGHGTTLAYAIESAKEVAEAIKGIDIKIDEDALDAARAQLERLAKAGIKYFL